jgi:hypothetical protein
MPGRCRSRGSRLLPDSACRPRHDTMITTLRRGLPCRDSMGRHAVILGLSLNLDIYDTIVYPLLLRFFCRLLKSTTECVLGACPMCVCSPTRSFSPLPQSHSFCHNIVCPFIEFILSRVASFCTHSDLMKLGEPARAAHGALLYICVLGLEG